MPNSVGHQNGKRDMAFGPLATTGGASPSWNGTGCAASYCHGNFKNGNSANAPIWTGANQAACGSCHGTPPGGTHPANSACGTCHTGYTATTVAAATHVDGQLQVAAQACTGCHLTAQPMAAGGTRRAIVPDAIAKEMPKPAMPMAESPVVERKSLPMPDYATALGKQKRKGDGRDWAREILALHTQGRYHLVYGIECAKEALQQGTYAEEAP